MYDSEDMFVLRGRKTALDIVIESIEPRDFREEDKPGTKKGTVIYFVNGTHTPQTRFFYGQLPDPKTLVDKIARLEEELTQAGIHRQTLFVEGKAYCGQADRPIGYDLVTDVDAIKERGRKVLGR